MKILYIVHQFYPEFGSGTENVTYNLANMMQLAGNKVKVVTYKVHPFKKEHKTVYDNIEYSEFIYQRLPVLAFRHIMENWNLNIELTNTWVEKFAEYILEKEKPDIVHLMHPMRVGGFAEVARKKNIPYIITLTDLTFVCPKIVMKTTAGDLCEGSFRGENCKHKCCDVDIDFMDRLEVAKKLIYGARVVTTPSDFIKGLILSEIDRCNIKILPHGIKPGKIIDEKKYEQNNLITFGYIGTIVSHKGLEILIEAFRKVKNDNVKLLIFGDYDNFFGHRMKELAKRDKRIFFEGKFLYEDIDKIYEKIDLLIVPSICYESYSLVKHEAIIRNIPVIVSNLGALPENIVNEKNSFIFDLSVENSLEMCMNQIMENTIQLNHVKKELEQYVVPTIEQESFQYLRVYKEFVSQNNN